MFSGVMLSQLHFLKSPQSRRQLRQAFEQGPDSCCRAGAADGLGKCFANRLAAQGFEAGGVTRAAVDVVPRMVTTSSIDIRSFARPA